MFKNGITIQMSKKKNDDEKGKRERKVNWAKCGAIIAKEHLLVSMIGIMNARYPVRIVNILMYTCIPYRISYFHEYVYILEMSILI